jgi:hypothetical protein
MLESSAATPSGSSQSNGQRELHSSSCHGEPRADPPSGAEKGSSSKCAEGRAADFGLPHGLPGSQKRHRRRVQPQRLLQLQLEVPELAWAGRPAAPSVCCCQTAALTFFSWCRFRISSAIAQTTVTELVSTLNTTDESILK